MEQSELEKKVWELFEQGLTDNEILEQLVSEEGEELTYMELRIMRADYEEAHPETVEHEEPEPEEEEEAEEDQVGVSVDSVTKPGSLISGTAHLPSGVKVTWMLDQFGRINIAPEGEEKPSQEDLQYFQEQLQQELQKRGGML